MLEREYAIWNDYALLDSGDGEKCEVFGGVLMVRPEPQALWRKADPELHWPEAHLVYSRRGKEGEWMANQEVPEEWFVKWENLQFICRPTNFKHTGLFPEQASNWRYLRETLRPGTRVLNLFGYTGGASLAAASVDAEVTHLDASKPVVSWTKENLAASALSEKKVRLIVDDAQIFVSREIRRGNIYDAILMDPPAFGRGPEGEVWQFERDLPPLVEACAKILNKEHGLLLINAYSLGYPALAIENLVRGAVPFVKNIVSTELTLKEQSERGFELPTGVAIRATW